MTKLEVTISKRSLMILLMGALIMMPEMTSASTSSDTAVSAVFGATPIIDGSIEAGEWNDAFTITIPVADDTNCTVYVKQDAVSLYLGFHIPDVTYNSSDCCVVIFDIDHDASTSLQTDDMWLRVSRNDDKGEFNVTAGGWYPTTVSSWTAKTSSTASGWQLEYNITYSILDVVAGTNKTLGIMLLIVDKDMQLGWYGWPSTASISKPATWSDLTSNGYNWIPEFSTWTSLFLVPIVLAVAIASYKRRLLKASLH